MTRLAILGGGFMGGALAEGLIDSGWSPEDVVVAELREDRRQHLEELLNVRCVSEVAEAAAPAETVVLAVKPQDVIAVLRRIAPVFDDSKLAVSICAGLRTATMEEALGQVPVIRAMPNTPAAIGEGATAIARGRYAADHHLATALNLLSTVGKVVVVDEPQMDAVTAVSGTGPAYVFYLAEALIEAAQEEGLSKEQAHVLVYQTITGAGRLLSHDPAGPAELRARVTSPQGTTEAAITYLQDQKWAETFREAVKRARLRSEELGRS